MTLKRSRNSDWKDPSRYLQKIFLEASSRHNQYAEEIIARAGLPVTVVPDKDFNTIVAGSYPANLSLGKTSLLLCANKGEFLKGCPATREYRCCDYQVINVGMGCPMDCVYCILQAYLNNPYISFFVNIDDLFTELQKKLDVEPSVFSRIGTGEFSDSMALDRITGLSGKLVSFFAQRENVILELKTKSAVVDNLKDLKHNNKTIISWSLNSPEIMAHEELRTSTLEQRLEAAAKCAAWGYPLSFHFDPIIAHDNWQRGYDYTIDALFSTVPKSAIRWISLGGFRYLPKLRDIATNRFPHSTIFFHEFIEGLDNKQRYFRPLRTDIYKIIYHKLAALADPNTCIYFCMESDEIWQDVMGFVPAQKGGLGAMLDASVQP